MVYNGSMIILVGASASGKTEVARALKREFGITKAVTHTTRAPRKGERTGIDYFFVTEQEFESLKKRGAFVETTEYNNHHYGTSKGQIDDDKVLIVDPNGLKAFLALNDKSIVSFNLTASKKTRIARMEERGDSKEEIDSRIKNDDIDFAPDKVSSAHFRINTEKKNISQVAEEVYEKYLEELSRRGIKPNLLII